ncbi:MAG: nucleoside monophosphate kinase [Vampirovibrionales bacterium]|nr:nucleoside monophosphate kinase [Vampirovibrionales bacterium]
MSNPLLIFPFISPPSGGKGTQTQRLSERYQLPRVDMGAMLRSVAASGSPLGERIKGILAEGKLVDTPTVLDTLKEGVNALLAEHQQSGQPPRGLILDGFPRNAAQAEGLDPILADLNARIAAVFYLDVPAEVIIERAANRLMSETSGIVYNLKTKPPKTPGICDVTGEKLIQRADDKPEVVASRLSSFTTETEPILARYEAQGLLKRINGNQPIDTVTDALIAQLEPLLQPVQQPVA